MFALFIINCSSIERNRWKTAHQCLIILKYDPIACLEQFLLFLWPPEATHNTKVLLSVSCKSRNVYCITMLTTWRRYRFFFMTKLHFDVLKHLWCRQQIDCHFQLTIYISMEFIPCRSDWEWRKNKLIKFNFKVIIDDIKVHWVSHFQFHFIHELEQLYEIVD